MARIRTIQPHFSRSPSMQRVTREARLLFVLLWTVVDDDGRCEATVQDLAQLLYPSDFDASMYLSNWLDELEREGCIERYAVDANAYLRVLQWHRHQQIDHPSPSQLPPSPNERPIDSRIRERSRKRRSKRRESISDQGLDDCFGDLREKQNFSPEAPVVITQDALIRHLDRIRAQAEEDGAHGSAIRSVVEIARLGLPAGNARANDDEEHSPSPAELLGLSETSGRRWRDP